ncbi:MAG: hypothetical protein ACW99Q_17845, partial [Candidatus Kariarchaeaceae archaeon]
QVERYFSDPSSIEVSKMFEDLGPWVFDYTNLQPWGNEMPDIHEHSARIFSIWAEENETKQLCLIIRGFFALTPFVMGVQTYYHATDKITPFYPMAILSNFRTNYKDSKDIDPLIGEAMRAINSQWRELRNKIIGRLEIGSELWHRYNFTIDKIIHFTIVCPSMDRELIESLRKRGYNTTGVMQVLSSQVEEYSKASIDDHIRKSQEIIRSSSEVDD